MFALCNTMMQYVPEARAYTRGLPLLFVEPGCTCVEIVFLPFAQDQKGYNRVLKYLEYCVGLIVPFGQMNLEYKHKNEHRLSLYLSLIRVRLPMLALMLIVCSRTSVMELEQCVQICSMKPSLTLQLVAIRWVRPLLLVQAHALWFTVRNFNGIGGGQSMGSTCCLMHEASRPLGHCTTCHCDLSRRCLLLQWEFRLLDSSWEGFMS